MYHYKLTLTSTTPLDFSQPVTIQPDQVLAVGSTRVDDVDPPPVVDPEASTATFQGGAAEVVKDPKAYTLELMNRAFKSFLKEDQGYSVEDIKLALLEDEGLHFKGGVTLSAVCVILDALVAQGALGKSHDPASRSDRYYRKLAYTTSFNTDGTATTPKGPQSGSQDKGLHAQILPLFQDGKIHSLSEVFLYLQTHYPIAHGNMDGRRRVAILMSMSEIVDNGTLIRPAGLSERYHLPGAIPLDGVLSTIDI